MLSEWQTGHELMDWTSVGIDRLPDWVGLVSFGVRGVMQQEFIDSIIHSRNLIGVPIVSEVVVKAVVCKDHDIVQLSAHRRGNLLEPSRHVSTRSVFNLNLNLYLI